MRIRALGVVGGWTVGVAAATAVSWAGVGLVGAEVSPSGPAALSQAEVQHRIQDATRTSATAPAPGRPSVGTVRPPVSSDPDTGTGPSPTGTAGTGPTSARAVPTSQRSVVTQGGTAVLTCTGDIVAARSSPGRGYGIAQDSEHGQSRIEVEFSDGTRTSKISAACSAGVLDVQVDERAKADDN